MGETVDWKVKASHIAESVFQQLLAVFLFLILWELFKNYDWSNIGTWHIILCTVGFVLCMSEALLIYNNENVFTKDMTRSNKKIVHGVMMAIACLSITIGISLKLYQKNERGSAHFTSTHGVLGLTSWILVFITVIGGLILAFSKRLFISARPFRIVHIIIGVSAYIIGIVALGFGLSYLSLYTGTRGRNALIVILALFVAYSLLRPMKTLYDAIRN